MEVSDENYTSSSSPVEPETFLCSSAFWVIIVILFAMAGITFILIALGLIGVSQVIETEGAHIKLSVYYESLCPDSRRFINNQLYPTIQTLGGVSNLYLETEFVPYGKATTEVVNGTFQFDCQHGNQECEGNRVHACALQKLPAADAAAFINCSMALFNSPITDPDCAASLGLNYTKIENCLNTWEASTLLAANGIRTHDLEPTLYYVPWIMFNNVFTVEDLDVAQRDLLGLLCDKLDSANVTAPAQCGNKMH